MTPRERWERWNARNPGLAARRAAIWAKANPERRKQLQRLSHERRKDQIRERMKAWYYKNRERVLARKAEWRAANRDRTVAYNAQWKRDNKARVCASTMRRIAAELRATPPWVDRSAVEAFYAEAESLTKQTGVKHHVDHIVPLRSTSVCGLHVQGNLQVLPHYVNESKGNKYWPDMPEKLCLF